MEYKELRKKIAERIEEYNVKIEGSEKEFFLRFLEKYPDTSIDTILCFEAGELLMAFIYKSKTFKYDDLNSCELMNKLGNYSIINTAKRFQDNTFDVKKMELATDFEDKETLTREIIKVFTRLNNLKLSELYVLIFSLQEEFYQMIEEELEEIKEITDNKSKKDSMIDEYAEKIKEEINDNEKMKTLRGKLDELYEYAHEVVGKLSIPFIRKTHRAYTKLLAILEQENKNIEITNIDQILRYTIEDDIRDYCLEYIYDHNMKYYKELEEEYEEKNKNSINAYISYFSTLNINFLLLDEKLQKKVMETPIDEIKEKMKIIINIAEVEDIVEVLINTSKEELKEIKKYISKELLTEEFIKSNIKIFSDKEKYDNFKDNLELLVNRVNLKKYTDKSFLLTDNEIIRNNINLLKRANIIFSNSTNLSMLKEPLKEKLELFIEVGLESSIKDNPDILNEDITLAKKVLIDKLVGNGSFDINNLIIDDGFYVRDSEIDRFMFDRDNSNYLNNSKIFIPSIEETELSYIYDGIIIPKSRVKIQPVAIEEIIKPSLYSKEEVKRLEKLI